MTLGYSPPLGSWKAIMQLSTLAGYLLGVGFVATIITFHYEHQQFGPVTRDEDIEEYRGGRQNRQRQLFAGLSRHDRVAPLPNDRRALPEPSRYLARPSCALMPAALVPDLTRRAKWF
jgi:hypothetical protein